MKNLSLQALTTGMLALCCVVSNPEYASAVTFVQAPTPVTILGNSYNVFFNKETQASTTFNNVYGTGSPTLTFTNATDATAAVNAIVANVPSSFYDPFGVPSSGFVGFFVPFIYSTNGFNRVGANYLIPNGPATILGAPTNNDAFSRTQAFNFSFVTFQQVTPVPEPSAIFGTLAVGLAGSAALYKRRLRRAS